MSQFDNRLLLELHADEVYQKGRDVSIAEVARDCDTSRAQMALYFHGEVKNPSLKVVAALARRYNRPIEDFLLNGDNPAPAENSEPDI